MWHSRNPQKKAQIPWGKVYWSAGKKDGNIPRPFQKKRTQERVTMGERYLRKLAVILRGIRGSSWASWAVYSDVEAGVQGLGPRIWTITENITRKGAHGKTEQRGRGNEEKKYRDSHTPTPPSFKQQLSKNLIDSEGEGERAKRALGGGRVSGEGDICLLQREKETAVGGTEPEQTKRNGNVGFREGRVPREAKVGKKDWGSRAQMKKSTKVRRQGQKWLLRDCELEGGGETGEKGSKKNGSKAQTKKKRRRGRRLGVGWGGLSEG